MGFFENAEIENKYLSDLSKEEKKQYMLKSRAEKKEILNSLKVEKEVNTKNENFNNIGINKPSDELEKTFDTLNLSAKLGGIMGGLGGATMSLKEQEFMKEHVSHTKQNFALMSQNEKIIKQNDEIIDLLKTIANK
ncbi:hypothetical protein A4A29_10335 [Staphylococcus equorum]|uniref:hypothetical protein n=1 Tax=Staphylococcus equorum TaxID=246432 RepID=UPI0008FB7CAA|nr:hypothetical protein [Staphylococcus equorum]OIS51577.1 hypothetical protein A4A29_10335 [Staphylococcus equorum]